MMARNQPSKPAARPSTLDFGLFHKETKIEEGFSSIVAINGQRPREFQTARNTPLLFGRQPCARDGGFDPLSQELIHKSSRIIVSRWTKRYLAFVKS
jgi:hypothetical protein